MDVSSLAGVASMMQSSQTQQTLSMAMIKQKAQAQDQVANMLMKNAQQLPQPAKNPDYGFSTYA